MSCGPTWSKDVQPRCFQSKLWSFVDCWMMSIYWMWPRGQQPAIPAILLCDRNLALSRLQGHHFCPTGCTCRDPQIVVKWTRLGLHVLFRKHWAHLQAHLQAPQFQHISSQVPNPDTKKLGENIPFCRYPLDPHAPVWPATIH